MKNHKTSLPHYWILLTFCGLLFASCSRAPVEYPPEESVNLSTFVNDWWVTIEIQKTRLRDFFPGRLHLTARKSWSTPPTETCVIDLEHEIVKDCRFTDLDNNNFHEAVIAHRVRGTGAYGSLTIVEWDGRHFRKIKMPRLTPEQRQAYRGHDQFQFTSNRILRRFPLYRKSDPNSNASGGERLIWYKKTGSQLVVEDVHDQ